MVAPVTLPSLAEWCFCLSRGGADARPTGTTGFLTEKLAADAPPRAGWLRRQACAFFSRLLHFLPLAEKQNEAVSILRLEENGLESERKEAFGLERRTNTTAFPN